MMIRAWKVEIAGTLKLRPWQAIAVATVLELASAAEAGPRVAAEASRHRRPVVLSTSANPKWVVDSGAGP
jgi:hypothetical protein